MRLAIISDVVHYKSGNNYLANPPYVKEMEIWAKKADEVLLLTLLSKDRPSDHFLSSYKHPRISLRPIPPFGINKAANFFRILFFMPILLWKTYSVMRQANHIHIHCPGYVSLVASLAQILFPSKPKTIKYDGNWSSSTTQPRSHRLQKWIMRSSFLTKNAKVLVYGDFDESNCNVIPFFNPIYSLREKINCPIRQTEGRLRFLFAGELTDIKNPLLACKVVYLLNESGMDCELNLFGEGPLQAEIESFIQSHGLSESINIMRTSNKNTLIEAYSSSHFLLSLSRSEDWPKVVAEAMWWGCLPVAIPVSCIPQMLGYGERGLLVYPYPESVIANIRACLNNPATYLEMCRKAMKWSRNHTLEKYEVEVHKLLGSFEVYQKK